MMVACRTRRDGPAESVPVYRRCKVAKFSLRRYEDQAKAGAALGIVACVSLLAQAFMVFRHVDTQQWVIAYGNPSRRYMVMITTAISLLIAVAALGLGLNSAGQRRNEKPMLSWVGFFIGAGVICLAIIFYMVFHLRSEFLGIGS